MNLLDAACGFYLGGASCMALPGIVRHWQGHIPARTFFYCTLLWPIATLEAVWRSYTMSVTVAKAMKAAELQALLREHGTQCLYRVDPGDDLEALCAEASVELAEVNTLNGDRSPKEYWRVGQEVTLPRALCLILEERDRQKQKHAAP